MKSIISGCAEIIYPKNNFGAPDWETVEITNRCADYLMQLPFKQRKRIYLVFLVFEYVFPLLFLKYKRFTKLSATNRQKIFNSLHNSKLYIFRLLFDAVKGILSMIYFSSPEVLLYIRYYKKCFNPDDSFEVRIKDK
jgi:hypothetical protein